MTKNGVLLINLGTPAEPTTKAVRSYLKLFLGDPRVIQIPRLFWWPILNLMILPARPKKSAKLYQSIWTENGSPLLYYTQQQTTALQAHFPDKMVRFAMSYSNPRIGAVLTEFEAAGVTDLTVIPLYPQYSTTTVGAVYDEVARFYVGHPQMPTLHFIQDFSDNPQYVQAMAAKIQTQLADADYDQILLSYHGIPKSYATKGDPYPQRCENCTALIAAQLKTEVPVTMTYQSKFGPNEWLTPATDATLKALPGQGVHKILVVTPSFVADCLETVEEIEDENRGYFMGNGGQQFDVVQPFNADPEFTTVLASLVR